MPRLKARFLCLFALAWGGLLSSCDRAPAGATGSRGEGEAKDEAGAMKGFSWVIGDQVAGLPRPGKSRPLDQDLVFLKAQGIDVLVSLTEQPLDVEALRRHGIEAVHIPVPDYHAPTQEQLEQYVNAVQSRVSASQHVGTHCAAGLGRTGTFLAALFVSRGMDGDAAIAEVRRLRPGSVETAEQEKAVREFAARPHGR